MTDESGEISRLAELAKGIRIAMLTTVDEEGHFIGVPMAQQEVEFDGDGEVVEDAAKARELWNSWVEAWLPQGPDDPNVVLIKVTGHGAEYWDTPGGRAASILSFAKAKLTGKRYEGAENERVDLDEASAEEDR